MAESNQSMQQDDNPFTHVGTLGFHITLVRPPAISTSNSMNISSLTPPIALAYLSASLRKEGFSVTNIDAIGEGLGSRYRLSRNPSMEAQGLQPNEILSRIPETTNLIGVSCMFSSEWPSTRDLINSIRDQFPKVPIVIGGEHATALPEFSLAECPAVDFLVLGEGETTLIALAHALKQKKPFQEIPGLYFRDGNKIVRPQNGPVGRNFEGASGQRIRNLDTLPLPAWDLTPLEAYLDKNMTFGRLVGRTMPIVGSRGCPHACTFCSNPTMWGRRYVTRSPKELVAEILEYKKTYGITAVEFYDLTPIVQKKWILEFCNELINRSANISWQISGGTRCETIDEEVIIKAKESGCGYLGFAPETGVPEVLARIKKRFKIPHLLNLVRLARRHNVDTRCNLIIGFPEDTRWQILRTLLFQVRLSFMGVVDCPVFEFTPYPGSEIFDQLRRENVIKDLSDDYFESLGLNVQFSNKRYCRAVSPRELIIYRTLGMTLFYGIYYIQRPLKVLSFIKNLFVYERSNSVFEQRIIQHLRKVYRRSPAA